MRDHADPRPAFRVADRRCRSADRSGADYLARSFALMRLGFDQGAIDDVRKAETLHQRGLPFLRWMLVHSGDPHRQTSAARGIIADPRAGWHDNIAAISFLLDRGQPFVYHARRLGRTVAGWVYLRASKSPSIQVQIADGSCFSLPGANPDSGVPNGVIWRTSFTLIVDISLVVHLSAALDGFSSSLTLYPSDQRSRTLQALDARDGSLSVILPVYGDPDSLSDCLEALRAEANGDADIRFIIIDDASPDDRVQALARQFTQATAGIYHRATLNAGFAASVNTGLSLSAAGDVLILNSDVRVTSGSIKRLRAAARQSPAIGTVSPLSNNAGQTTFPDPLRPAPAPDKAEASRIDAAAQAANPGVIVDLVAPLGSCLYVTRACLNRVGPLSLVYGRGYYEDIDFCLRASEAGFRNVAACDVYVAHLGGRSFGSDKLALVDRNHTIACRRFPGYASADAVFDLADPLRPQRAAIERRLDPQLNETFVVVAPALGEEAVLSHLAAAQSSQGRATMMLRWRDESDLCEATLSVSHGPGPRSLRFTIAEDGASELVRYLDSLEGATINVVEADRLPRRVQNALLACRHPIALLVDRRSTADAVLPLVATSGQRSGDVEIVHRHNSIRRWSGRATVMAVDGMARSAIARARLAQKTDLFPCVPGAPPGQIGTLGVVMPCDCPEAERLVLALARRMSRLGDRALVVLGSAIDEQQLTSCGNTWVTGPMQDDDVATVAAHHGVEALFSPYRSSEFWALESARDGAWLRGAYFDWSGGRFAPVAGDLCLEDGLAERNACDAIVAWMGIKAASLPASP